MSGTYLVCDLCGNFGPPAGFFFKEGVRMCYECYFGERIPEGKTGEPFSDGKQDESSRVDTVLGSKGGGP
jgi:hypothetical protein